MIKFSQNLSPQIINVFLNSLIKIFVFLFFLNYFYFNDNSHSVYELSRSFEKVNFEGFFNFVYSVGKHPSSVHPV